MTLLIWLACGGDTPTDPTDVATDGTTDSTTGAEPTDACTELVEGRWSSSNETCFGMGMNADLTLDTDGCTFTFSSWNMSMDSPTGGVVSGSDITLTGAGWDDCTGTTDGSMMDATCGNGCVFHMEVM